MYEILHTIHVSFLNFSDYVYICMYEILHTVYMPKDIFLQESPNTTNLVQKLQIHTNRKECLEILTKFSGNQEILNGNDRFLNPRDAQMTIIIIY